MQLEWQSQKFWQIFLFVLTGTNLHKALAPAVSNYASIGKNIHIELFHCDICMVPSCAQSVKQSLLLGKKGNETTPLALYRCLKLLERWHPERVVSTKKKRQM